MMKIAAIAALVAVPVFALTLNTSLAQPADASGPAGAGVSAPADNSKTNHDPSNRDRSADKQSNNSSDLEITQQVRRRVMDDKELSTYAHNTKIVSVNGTVTLNGVVHSDAEKTQIAQKAAEVVGADHVVNEIKVAGQ
jgi:hyperosmotically inducible periplasmic protein